MEGRETGRRRRGREEKKRKELKGAASLSSKQPAAKKKKNQQQTKRANKVERVYSLLATVTAVLAVQKVVKSAISPVASLAWLRLASFGPSLVGITCQVQCFHLNRPQLPETASISV